MNREKRKQLAQETLSILNKGFYYAGDKIKNDIQADLDICKNGTLLYKSEDYIELKNKLPDNSNKKKTKIEVTDETTLLAAGRLKNESQSDHILCLNFASAKNPGGGYLSGSQAQEESLARSSGLYASIVETHEYYDYNKKMGTSLYSDYMIYSSNVPVFRNDNGELLKEYYLASFITAPAVNAGAVKRNEPEKIRNIISTMVSRTEKVLLIAAFHKVDTLVLGAWGCGVFQNKPEDIAETFYDQLIISEMFKDIFRKIIFAVPGKDKINYRAFSDRFNR